ncbi:MAG TPA: hypothetical protein VJO13_19465 [Ktedonobacterales bacterium]|nr:hypothetical protein [Ktedonobacterales bacterium]
MANTFQDQANERFDKATAFLNSSRMLLRNDLIYVSALADAVSAIKNMVQGYLYTQIAQKPAGTAPQSWQEAAASNSMPDLLRAAAEAGLRLPNLLGPRINQLNRDRNSRTHDDPKRLIDYARAQEAITIAEEVRRTVRTALGVSAAPAKVPAAAAVAPVAPSPLAPIATAPAAAPAIAAPALASDELEERDDDVSPATPGWGRRLLRTLGRIAAVLLLLVVGLAAGVGIMIPVASGNAPSWLGFATRLLPTPSAVQTATSGPTATPTSASSGPIILGTITVSPPVCGAGGASFQMHNVGTAPAQWAIGSPGAMQPIFALTAGATPQVALFGSLASTSEVTVYVSGRTPVVLTTDGGAVQLTLPTC